MGIYSNAACISAAWNRITKKKFIASKFSNPKKSFDIFSKIDFIYDDAVASIRVGKGVKSEGGSL